MNEVFQNSAMSTKIRAMVSELLRSEDFIKLANAPGRKELFKMLEEYPAYQDIFTNIDADTISRIEIEHILLYSIHSDYSKLYMFANGKQRNFLKLHLKYFEIAILKRIIRTCLQGKKTDLGISYLNQFFLDHSELDFAKLATSTDLAMFLENLKGSIYFDILRKIPDDSPLMEYELTLDIFYYRHIWQHRNEIGNKTDLEVLIKTVGTHIELLNLNWAYRAKKYYHLSPSEVYKFIIPIRYKLKKEELQRYVEAGDFDEMQRIYETSYYGKIRTKYLKEYRPSPEALTEILLNIAYIGTYRKYPYSIANINTYLYLKESEIRYVVSIIEAIKYSLPPNQIIKDILKFEQGDKS